MLRQFFVKLCVVKKDGVNIDKNNEKGKYMNIVEYISGIIIPLIVSVIVLNGLLTKTDVYESFIKGAKEGAKTVVGIFPTLVGLMAAVGIMRNSGLLDAIGSTVGMVSEYIRIPGAVVPVMLIKLFSASAATGLVLDIFREYGTDSYEGLMASLFMCCSETLFYTLSMYCMEVKVKKTRWIIPGALFSLGIGAIVCVILCNM